MAGAGAKIRIGDIRTVGIPVTDQDRAIGFYVETLGFEKRLDAPFGPGRRWVEVAPPGATTSIALVGVGEGTAGVDTQIRLTTEDAAAAHAGLHALGVDTDDELLLYPIPMFAFRDQDGNRLVIVEQPARGSRA
jgi:catechol 2,3-dioxygenase-like lactoylglutathione lyase family enzyme